MADARTEHQLVVQEQLARMNEAFAGQQIAYQSFIMACREFQWQSAADCQLLASAHFDAVMDSFVKACRAMEEGSKDA